MQLNIDIVLQCVSSVSIRLSLYSIVWSLSTNLIVLTGFIKCILYIDNFIILYSMATSFMAKFSAKFRF